jgi:hypothetical protein
MGSMGEEACIRRMIVTNSIINPIVIILQGQEQVLPITKQATKRNINSVAAK